MVCLWFGPAAVGDEAAREAVAALEAYAVYKMGNYAEAHRRFLELARQDNIQGMLNVANMLQAGLGVERDQAAALVWYRRAAERGSAIGMFYTAEAYLRGYGTRADPLLAREWLERAAAAGSSEAQLELGKLLQRAGETEQAIGWIRRAARGGDSIAAAYLESLDSPNEDGGVAALDCATIENAWAAVDRAAVNRNAPGVAHYLAHDAQILVRLPGAANWTPMNKKQWEEFWQRSFDEARDYKYSRGAATCRARADKIEVESVIREQLDFEHRVENLRLQESALVTVRRDQVIVERLSVIIERF